MDLTKYGGHVRRDDDLHDHRDRPFSYVRGRHGHHDHLFSYGRDHGHLLCDRLFFCDRGHHDHLLCDHLSFYGRGRHDHLPYAYLLYDRGHDRHDHQIYFFL